MQGECFSLSGSILKDGKIGAVREAAEKKGRIYRLSSDPVLPVKAGRERGGCEPANLRLFIWQNGDTGHAGYRLGAPRRRTLCSEITRRRLASWIRPYGQLTLQAFNAITARQKFQLKLRA